MPSIWPTIEWWPSIPILLLVTTAVVVLLLDVIVTQRGPMLSLVVSLAGMGLALFVIIHMIPQHGDAPFYRYDDLGRRTTFLLYDNLGRLGAVIALAGGCLIALVSPRTIRLYGLPPAEYYALLTFAVFGMVVLCISLELLTIFLAIEIIAVALYILTGLHLGCAKSTEAALKYFVLGAFSSGFLIFGFAFLYGGAGGSTLLGEIGVSMVNAGAPWMMSCLALGLALALAGFAFKLTLAPFHLYAADVYEGAPTPVAALLATGTKVAGFVALIHLLTPLHQHIGKALQALATDLVDLLWILAALSIIVGNVVALLQRNIKRMLAYSSIAHSGYLLIAILVFVEGSVLFAEIEEAVLVYLVAYVLMNVAAFGVALTLGEQGERDIDDYAGLAQRSPGLALAMALAMLSLTGIPGTVGFVGKFYVFLVGVEAEFVILVIVAVLGSVVSAYYYLRVIVFMYMRDPAKGVVVERVGLIQGLGLVLATVPIIGFGILPRSLLALLAIV